MSSTILVINSGSSSLKYQLIDIAGESVLARGNHERIGEPGSEFVDHAQALASVLREITASGNELHDIAAVGHRVVHGGPDFAGPVVVDSGVMQQIEALIPLAPLHNAANVVGMRVVAQLLPTTPQVAVFDTSFHTTIPDFAHTYAVDVDVAHKYALRRYGFHGTSHQFVAQQTARLLGVDVDQLNAIVCHIGNGASITAISAGKSVDTSMGMTPLEGLVMGTRSGDIDPGVLFHLTREAGYSIDQLDALLNRESGLKGLTGSSDMREVLARADAGDQAAVLARKIYAYRIRKYIGAYLAVVPNVQAVVFTAGVGENDPKLRLDVIAPLQHLGLSIDASLNQAPSRVDRVISSDSAICVAVVATNEELAIARQAAACVGLEK